MLTLDDIIHDFETWFDTFCEDYEIETGIKPTNLGGYTKSDMADLAKEYMEHLEQDFYYYGSFTYDPEERLADEIEWAER